MIGKNRLRLRVAANKESPASSHFAILLSHRTELLSQAAAVHLGVLSVMAIFRQPSGLLVGSDKEITARFQNRKE